MVNKYSIYAQDIKPKGFRAVEFDGYVTQAAVEETKKILEDTSLCQEIVDHNYKIAEKFFSFSVLRERLKAYLTDRMQLRARA